MSSQNTEQAQWIEEEIRPHEKALRGYLHNQFPAIDADDVVQESYLKILRAQTGRRIASSKAYFFAIARNTARRLFRRSSIYSTIPVNDLPDSCLLDDEHDAAEQTQILQMQTLVIEAIDRLPPRCAKIFRLAALQGYSNAEIAESLDLSESTVRVQLARGIKKCAAFLREYGDKI